ncbi:MAG TPA: lysophospholipid acyltransferase family protein [Polyangiaceae bacterium]|nr:lysophospholipid acyltransferase family protein [Polyangiaceae bacterium]
MTRKDKKQNKPTSAAKRAGDKKRKGKGKSEVSLSVTELRALRARSEAPSPRGSKGKTKKRKKRSEGEQQAPDSGKRPSAAPASAPLVDAQVLPQVELDTSYELTADGDDLDQLSADAPELGIGSRVVAPNVRFEEDALESFRPSASPGGDVEAQIRALEARLDGLIQGASRGEAGASNAPADNALELEGDRASGSADAIALESAAELADSNYYVKKWGRKGLRSRAEEVDEFGLDRSFDARLRPVLDFIYRRYFRIQTEGIDNVPREGRAVVVGNHSGSIPIDGLMLRTALRTDHPASRDLRWLAEDFLFYLPFAGVFMNRAGAVRACQENAERLLLRDNLIAVFPEGVQGIRKLFRDRYRLQRFGRGGYIRLCLRTRAPLIPCAIIGGEEASPLLYRFDALADLLQIPYLPVTPTFPALGALGLLPAPTKWRIKFGEPIAFDNYGPEAADDDLLVGRLSERVRSTIQSMLEIGLKKRSSVWF